MNLITSISLSLLLGSLALVKKALTPAALLVAIIFSFIIAFFGGLTPFIILVIVFLGSIITKLFNKKQIKEKRKLIQIISNVGLPTLSIILFHLEKKDIYLLIYASIMAESLADTLASDIGILSKKDPINILTWHRSPKGLSGNISLLGLFSSLIGSILISLIYFIGIKNDLISSLIILLSGFIGSLIDSFLGALLQVKYKCSKCKKITEKRKHCNQKTNYYQGIKWIDNNMVNLLSNLIIFVILCLLYV